MANGYIKAAQIIADDQTEVATKLQTLLDTEQIDSGELNNLEITSFGTNKFLIAITYAALRSIGKWSTKIGLKISAPRVLYKAYRGLNTKIGTRISFIDAYKAYRKLSTTLGLKLSTNFKLGTVLTNTIGLKISSPVWKFPSVYRLFTTGAGLLTSMGYTYHDTNLDRTLSTISGLKLVWEAKYNGVPIEFD